MYNRYVVVDIETTGNIYKDGIDKITQVAAVVIENGEVIEIFSTFVNPGKSIPPFIAELTGIDDDLVQNAPSFQDVAPMIAELLENSCFVAHNVHFDWRFLQEEMKLSGFSSIVCPSIDTVELARILLPTAESHKLGDLAKLFALEHENPHRADSDAMVTAELFLLLCDKLAALPLVTLQSLYNLSRSLKSHISELLSALILDKLVSGSQKEKYDIHRNIALRKRSYEAPAEEASPIGFSAWKTLMQQNDHLNGLEYRAGQMQMAEEVYSAFSSDRISLVEAGTGTGKTLAYLIPSLFHARKAEQPVVISTQTIQLQQQIMEKEIPILRELLPFSFQTAVMKGRKHYICLQKFEHVLEEPDENYDTVLTKAKILVWLLETETGDVDELNLPTGGKLLWERICSGGNSAGMSNPWNSRCFYQQAKHRVLFADLIVTNHALLLQDATNEDSLLSSYGYVVLDEAHHIEEAASHMLGEQFSCMQFQLWLSRMGTLETDNVLSNIRDILGDTMDPAWKKIHHVLKEVKWESDELFRLLRSFIFEKNKSKQADSNVRVLYRYERKTEKGKLWNAITEGADRLMHMLAELYVLLQGQVQKSGKFAEYVIVQQFTALVDSLDEMRQTLLHLLLQEQQDGVTWFEAETKGSIHSTIIYKQPIDVSDLLADRFFAKKKSVVLTSATLTVNHTFDYIIRALGLSDFCPSVMAVSSPFQYDQQVRMMVPTDLPSIKQVPQNEYVEAIARHITKIAKVTNGRMLVLFTSYEMLRQTHAAIKETGALEEFALLAQGVSSSRMRMTKQFQQFEKSILFGTSSFWEGIDIPGESLSCLVMVRLPFVPPDHPIMAAKGEQIERDGGNTFIELALPQAILRFKQGFGRLIRTKSDTGTFFVLDRRITTTFYGKRFITSIPAIPLYEQPLQNLLELIENG